MKLQLHQITSKTQQFYYKHLDQLILLIQALAEALA